MRASTVAVDELTSATGAGTGDGPVPAGRRHRRPVLGRPNRPVRHRGRRRDRRRRSFDVRAGTPVRLSRRPGTGPDGGRRLPQSQHVAVVPSGWQSAGCQSADCQSRDTAARHGAPGHSRLDATTTTTLLAGQQKALRSTQYGTTPRSSCVSPTPRLTAATRM